MDHLDVLRDEALVSVISYSGTRKSQRSDALNWKHRRTDRSPYHVSLEDGSGGNGPVPPGRPH